MHTKIATCCYCGTRAALVLKGDVTHELACASCGAPLHDMKHLRVKDSDRPKKAGPKRATGRDPLAHVDRRVKKKTKTRKKTKKGLAHRFLDDAFDLLDDIFD